MNNKAQIALALIATVVVLWLCGITMPMAHQAFLDYTNQLAQSSE